MKLCHYDWYLLPFADLLTNVYGLRLWQEFTINIHVQRHGNGMFNLFSKSLGTVVSDHYQCFDVFYPVTIFFFAVLTLCFKCLAICNFYLFILFLIFPTFSLLPKFVSLMKLETFYGNFFASKVLYALLKLVWAPWTLILGLLLFNSWIMIGNEQLRYRSYVFRSSIFVALWINFCWVSAKCQTFKCSWGGVDNFSSNGVYFH